MKAHAREMFSQVFMQSTPYPFDIANSYGDSTDEASHSATSEEAGGTEALPSTD